MVSTVQGGVDSTILYHDYIMVWVQDLQLTLLEVFSSNIYAPDCFLSKHKAKYKEQFLKEESMFCELTVINQ